MSIQVIVRIMRVNDVPQEGQVEGEELRTKEGAQGKKHTSKAGGGRGDLTWTREGVVREEGDP